MAIYYFHTDPVGRATGRQATGAAAYISGERITDERTGTVHDHSQRQDVSHREIFLPTEFAAGGADWAKDREKLWNTAEQAERRRNARVAREYQVALPAELPVAQRVELARTFSQELADRYNVAVDLAVHEPRLGGDPRNFHAHLLTTTREVTADGLGAKAGLDMSTVVRRERGIDGQREFFFLRERWATLTNEALREANIDARVDHRGRAAQQADWIALQSPRQDGHQALRPPVRPELRGSLHEEYRQKVAAYIGRQPERASEFIREPAPGSSAEVPSRRSADLPPGIAPTQTLAMGTAGRVTEDVPTSSQPHSAEKAGVTRQTTPESGQPLSGAKLLAEIRRQARETWLRMRPKEVESAAAQQRDTTRQAEPNRQSRPQLQTEGNEHGLQSSANDEDFSP